MKVVFVIQDLKCVDVYFGWVKNIVIYDVSFEGYYFFEVIQFDGDFKEDGNEDKLVLKIEVIKDCMIFYVVVIGGFGVVWVVVNNIYLMKVVQFEVIDDFCVKFEDVLKGLLLFWLCKVLVKGWECSFDFED